MDLRFFLRACLHLRVLEGERRKLHTVVRWRTLTPEQETVLSFVEYCFRMGLPVRLIIDKCRKLGMSTLIQATAFWLCCFRENYEAMVVAQSQPDADKIAKISRLFNDKLPDPCKRAFGAREVGNALVWKKKHGSLFEAMSQLSKGASRGSDPSLLHLSELGVWDDYRSSTTSEQYLTGILGAVPLEAGTIIAIESTANGYNTFYDRFRDARLTWDNPDVDDDLKVWRPFFFSWQGVPKYSMNVKPQRDEKHRAMAAAVEAGDDRLAHRYASELGYDREWYGRVIQFGLTASQTQWALRKLKEFNGDLDTFDQEFPLTWQMSFRTSGRPTFDQNVLSRWMCGEAMKPQSQGWVLRNDKGDLGGAGDDWRVYVPPVAGHEYVVGTDSAEGGRLGDWSVAQVFDRNTREFVAEYRSKQPPEVLGEQAVRAAVWFNSALIAPEENNHGGTTIRRILDLGYRRLQLRHPGKAVTAGRNWRNTYGTKIHRGNRDNLVNLLARAVREETVTIHSRRLLDDMTVFVRNKNGKAEAMPGCHDDTIWGAIHCLHADRTQMKPRPIEIEEAPAPRLDGWQAARAEAKERGRDRMRPAWDEKKKQNDKRKSGRHAQRWDR
jgi:hypothetical protein